MMSSVGNNETVVHLRKERQSKFNEFMKACAEFKYYLDKMVDKEEAKNKFEGEFKKIVLDVSKELGNEKDKILTKGEKVLENLKISNKSIDVEKTFDYISKTFEGVETEESEADNYNISEIFEEVEEQKAEEQKAEEPKAEEQKLKETNKLLNEKIEEMNKLKERVKEMMENSGTDKGDDKDIESQTPDKEDSNGKTEGSKSASASGESKSESDNSAGQTGGETK